jgi:hypothetical protein
VRRSAASRSESRIKSNEENREVELMHDEMPFGADAEARRASSQCISRLRGGQAREFRSDLYFSRILIYLANHDQILV